MAAQTIFFWSWRHDIAREANIFTTSHTKKNPNFFLKYLSLGFWFSVLHSRQGHGKSEVGIIYCTMSKRQQGPQIYAEQTQYSTSSQLLAVVARRLTSVTLDFAVLSLALPDILVIPTGVINSTVIYSGSEYCDPLLNCGTTKPCFHVIARKESCSYAWNNWMEGRRISRYCEMYAYLSCLWWQWNNPA